MGEDQIIVTKNDCIDEATVGEHPRDQGFDPQPTKSVLNAQGMSMAMAAVTALCWYSFGDLQLEPQVASSSAVKSLALKACATAQPLLHPNETRDGSTLGAADTAGNR